MSQNPDTPAFMGTEMASNQTISHHPHRTHWQPQSISEPSFYYFAYGSCMCPVDLKRTFGENTHQYVVGIGILEGYRLGFYRRSLRRNCGALDVVKDCNAKVEGVLYRLPWRFSEDLDEREEVPRNGYRRELVTIESQGKVYRDVRTYVVIDKLPQELAPNDWYLNVVLRGAITCGLSEEYCWNLFNHMYGLQLQQKSLISKSA
ncbi:gamma-glutamylcyclotransferase [Crocosphaera sp. Alani8]|uniref:gamma-glutamylcyclotransferase n=1 Tax=Crocosphaera sp. Alani8 TaxID=3038952 RepID=UPI00313D21FD